MVPEQLRCTPTHEWCVLDGKIALLGVTEYALTSIGSVVYIDLHEAGSDVLADIPFGEIEGTDAT